MARMVNRIVKRVTKAVGVLAPITVAGLAVLLAALGWTTEGRRRWRPQWSLRSWPYHLYLEG